MYLWTRPSRHTVFFLTLYIFFKAIGFIPARLQNLDLKKGTPTFVLCRRGSLYNGLLIVLFSAISFFSFRGLVTADYPNRSPTTEIIELVKVSLGVIIVFIVWIWICVHRREPVQAANDFLEIASDMMRYKHLYTPNTLILRVSLVCIFNSLVWINLAWSDYVAFADVPTVSYMASTGPNFIFNWFLLMYTFNIITLRMQFRAVNDGILSLSRQTLVSVSGSSDNFDDKLVMKIFLALKHSHMRLHQVISRIENFYSFPILLIIAELCASIIFTSYYFIVSLLLPSEKASPLLLFNSMCYLAMEVFPIAMMTISIGQIVQEFGRTADAVHKFLARARLSRTTMAELRLFSLELLHQHVQFTACGIFTLDGTLLHSICGMTATYLIILIQFQPKALNSDNSNFD